MSSQTLLAGPVTQDNWQNGCRSGVNVWRICSMLVLPCLNALIHAILIFDAYVDAEALN